MAKFELEPYHRNISEEELITDLKRVAGKLNKDFVTLKEYFKNGKFRDKPFYNRFGSWNKALEKAGLNITRNYRITEEEYFKDLEEVWIKLGRQPHLPDMHKPISKYSGSSYDRKFGTWRKALEEFIKYINKEEITQVEKEPIAETKVIATEKESIVKHTTKRNISGRLKVQVLIRDGNKCRLCGVTVTGENIHFDHIKAWSKGGETVLENLQVLCAEHNLAKGNL
jgi:predicted restriction endonuclease